MPEQPSAQFGAPPARDGQAADLPLAAAAQRLRRPPRRSRRPSAEAHQANAPRSGPSSTGTYKAAVPQLCPVEPRLLDLPTAAGYLSVSPWTVRDLEAAGLMARVRVPLPGGGELRKLLFDRQDLDRLIAAWKDTGP